MSFWVDPRDQAGEQVVLRRGKEDPRRGHHRAVQRPERADRDRRRYHHDSRGTDDELCHVRRDQLGVLHLLDGNQIEVHEVGAQVEHDDRGGAEQQRARQDLLRVAHLAAHERQIGPAVVGPEDRHHREQKRRQPDRGTLREDPALGQRRRTGAEREAQHDEQRERADLEHGAQVL